MGATADYAKLLKNTHCSICSINKEILIEVITLLPQMKKSPSPYPPFFIFNK